MKFWKSELEKVSANLPEPPRPPKPIELKHAGFSRIESEYKHSIRQAEEIVQAELDKVGRRNNIIRLIDNEICRGHFFVEMNCSYFHDSDIPWLEEKGYKVKKQKIAVWCGGYTEPSKKAKVDGLVISWGGAK